MSQEFNPSSSPELFWGTLSALAIFLCCAFSFCTYYCISEVRLREDLRNRNRILAPVAVDRSGWIDEGAFNGTDEEQVLAAVQASSRSDANNNSVRNSGLPTGMNTSKSEFRTLLVQYYSKYSPTLTVEDVDIIVDSHFESQELRSALDQQLKNEFGEGINDYYRGIQNGSIAPPATLIANEREVAPSVQFVQDKPLGATPDGVMLTLRTDLFSALNARGIGQYLDLFHQNGIQGIDDMRLLDESVVRAAFPNRIQQQVLDMVATAKLLHIAENEPDI
mmetsp:Transcript_5203/g.6041  ORF Transcript_5203/g.6041 Transcript_5203/m.6041 type:complete len:278 (+) Transcript_5203:241-1074(+)